MHVPADDYLDHVCLDCGALLFHTEMYHGTSAIFTECPICGSGEIDSI